MGRVYYPETKRAYYLKNRERIIQQTREYKRTRKELPLHRRDYQSYIRMLAGKAKLRKWDYDLTYEHLYDVWNNQHGRCALTDAPLLLEANHHEAGSLDRIDSTKGYVIGNVRFVCAIVNRMKQELPDQEFFHFCGLVTNKNEKTTY